MSDFSKIISKGKKNLEKEFEKKKEFIKDRKKIFNLKKQLKSKDMDLKELYEEYGKSCFEGHPDKNIENSIEDTLDDILDLEVALKEAEGFGQDAIFCTICGKICDSDSLYCSKCGKKLF